MANGKLTPKQEAFVAEYLIDLNATAAAGRAGYSDPNIGRQLITKDNVQDAIAQSRDERAARTQVTADRVVLELARIAFSDPRALYRPDGTLKPPCEWDDDAAAAVSGVETDESSMQVDETTRITTRTHRVKRWDKVAALVKLGHHLGMFNKVKEVRKRVIIKVLRGGASFDDL